METFALFSIAIMLILFALFMAFLFGGITDIFYSKKHKVKD